MKGGDKVTKKNLLILVIVLAFGLFYGLSVYACGKEDNCPMVMKDAKIEVNNIANGVEVKITSDNPEVVNKIQEHKANCQHDGLKDAKSEVTSISNGVLIKITSDNPEVVKKIQEHKANCLNNGHKEGFKGCQEAHKSGKCVGHETSGCNH